MSSRTERFAALAFAATAITGCTSELVLPYAKAPAPVDIIIHDDGTDLDADGYLGIVVAGRSIDIVAPEAGTVEQLHVDLGDFVSVNSLLAKIDAPDLYHEVKRAEAQAKAQRAAAAQYGATARQARRRAKVDARLAEQGYVSSETVVESQASGASASAAIGAAAKQAQVHVASVEHLQERIASTSMTAPFTGRVAATYVDEGATVLAGSRMLRLVDEEAIEVRFAVPETQASHLQVGAVLKLCADGISEVANANVSRISPEVDASSGMVFFEATIDPNQGQWLRSGTRVRVHATAVEAC